MITRTFPTGSTVFTPYQNRWNENVYTRRESFSERPWSISAGSTSGAAVVMGDSLFVGLIAPCDGRFEWDRLAQTLTVTAPEEALFWMVGATVAEAWGAYHRQLDLPAPEAPFGRIPEYCTWVEQVLRSAPENLPDLAFSPQLVDEYLEQIDAHGWPRGRFTLDGGWCPRHGPGGFGTWDPRPGIDPAQLAAKIAARGHVPGLWLAPALICPASNAAREFPQSVGSQVDMPGETPWNRFHYIRPGPQSAEIIDRGIRRAYGWGFRKLKLDISYGNRTNMMVIARQCWDAIQALPEPVELEGHVPDPFIAQYCHVVRVNDVLISPRFPRWRSVAEGHFEVCARSAPRHLLNLDHIGGNARDTTAAEFLEHTAILGEQLARGYPVLSRFPQAFGTEGVSAVTALLERAAGAQSKAPTSSPP